MKKIGCFKYLKEEEYYINDDCIFCDKDGVVLDDETLNNWAVCLNSPWSQSNLRYVVELNCKDAYTLMDKTEPEWRAIYKVTGYEGIYTELYGYGNTPDEALKDCDRIFDYLQATYNKNDESF